MLGEVVKATNQQYQGFADFFVTDNIILAGREFYVFLKPDTVSDVRHTFTVKGLPEETTTAVENVKEVKNMEKAIEEMKTALIELTKKNDQLENENEELTSKNTQLMSENTKLDDELNADGCRGCW